ncbi:MAG: 1-deoxy-D-xylulose-5-phosphate reductoisomerase, partial [Clostridia bacterium]|nr:1-deoxy-D-xylulose-5-phosphate reductoisomerase [Clostridia bacterium]
QAVGPKEALQHPTWVMGKKVTVDSATMMNKGLEVIEAHWLFQVPVTRIQVVVHPQSIIHSMVEFVDGAIMAQMGIPDMRQPIQTALTWPRRMKSCSSYLDLMENRELTFEEPDYGNFPCLRIAYDAMKAGGTMPALMNGANEGAVEAFLAGKIKFQDIPVVIRQAMDAHQSVEKPKLSDVLAANEEGKSMALKGS